MAKLLPHHVPVPERRAAMASLVVAVGLLAVKFIAYMLTGSTAIFSDALESIVNVMAASFAAFAVTLAHQPADEDHPYGHGKIEFLSASFEGGMIVLAGGVAAFKAIEAILRGPDLNDANLGLGLALMGAALIVNGGLGLTLIRVGKSSGSMSLEADGWHLISDAVTSLLAIAALLVFRVTGWTYADPIAALLMAAYLFWLGSKLLARAAAGLMDRQDKHDEQLLQNILNAHVGPAGKDPRICSYHKLRHRHSGRYHWVDFHIMIPAHLDIDTGHKIASSIEYEIEQALGEGNATAHVEPCMDPACNTCFAMKSPGKTDRNDE